MKHNIYIYILISGLVSYLIRVLPLTLIRRQITSPFLKSFLYYVPYATLAVMTFPAMIYASQSMAAGIVALCIGIVMAWKGQPLLNVSIFCCLTVFILELFL